MSPLQQRALFVLSVTLGVALLPVPIAHGQDAAPPSPPPPQQQAPQPAQPVVQIGALNVPYQVLDENNQWSATLPVLSNADVAFYIADVSNNVWLGKNAENFLNTGQYTITLLSFYKTRRVCRTDQIGAGFSDADHVNACNDYRYRVRQLAVDTQQATVTVLLSAMIFADGTMDPGSIRHETRTHGIPELDGESQSAILKVSALVAQQSRAYDRRLRQLP